MNVLAFNLKTIPDTTAGRVIYDLGIGNDALNDKDTAKAMYHLRQQQTGDDCLPLYLQRIVAISIIERVEDSGSNNNLSVYSLGDDKSSEAELLRLFYDIANQKKGPIVSWNGAGFDLPLLNYRSLNNEVIQSNSFHDQYIDLMGELSNQQQHQVAPLDDIASLVGFPHRKGMNNAQRWNEYLAGNIEAIRSDAEIEAFKTFLVYLHYQLMCGKLNHQTLEEQTSLIRTTLAQSNKKYLRTVRDSFTW